METTLDTGHMTDLNQNYSKEKILLIYKNYPMRNNFFFQSEQTEDEEAFLEENLPTPKVIKSEEEWKIILKDEEYQICRMKQTEEPFCEGSLFNCELEGYYSCKGCGVCLFTSNDKFKTNTGWPSFSAPTSSHVIHFVKDVWQTEIICSTCHCHLGYYFMINSKSCIL
jgi:peptide-methionine (R)-S-oxide reductase